MNEHLEPAPIVPPWLRTLGYIAGAVGAFGVGPIGVAIESPLVVAIGLAVSGTGNALAFGYRPTR